ncbi:sulfotransferase [Novosphingobium cyanobacteriorum]|uniref:Sulfotransferase n=1 Tax=Novosphingobium cyanobacteriorum TaxID=3024215 RepID=A0ABT6CMZ8_9SPHN|nr:sulfotransferase [Novosphingobium cyanobacteriorum]MDF8335285.1 sulfotransferase [Novosphingobium cyanobacteriorum]
MAGLGRGPTEIDRLLATESILASAEIASGTLGLVDEGLQIRAASLISALRSGGSFSVAQALATRRQLVKLLARRLTIARDIAAHPEILDEVIADPVFIIGFPRTGTSIQQSLLAADPANRALHAWQVYEPSPPPGERPVTAARKAAAARVAEHFCDRCPGILSLHPYWDEGAETLIEDEEVLTLALFDNYPVALCDAPTLAIREGGGDFTEAYRFMKQFLQHQQWRQPKRRWVLKGIEHQRHLTELFTVFPDARCLFPHREPEAFLPSNLAIAAVVYDGITGGALDRRTLAAGYLVDFAARIDAVLSEPAMADPRVRHIRFSEFIAEPIGSLRACYADWGFAWTEEAEAAMRAWLTDPANDSDRYGRHKYTFEPFGVDWTAVSPGFDAYRKRFLGQPSVAHQA